jgi:glycerol-3-phosphate cytidylyltransferase
MTYCFDIDGTICTIAPRRHYNNARPLQDMIDAINRLYTEGHIIRLATARGNSSGIDWLELTKRQLDDWGVKYHDLCVGKKLGADYYVDDKGLSLNEFRKTLNKKTGILAGSFDIIHAGYIYMFEDSKRVCDHLIVALQKDPSLERPHKLKPTQSLRDRKLILESLRCVDEVQVYDTEENLYELLKKSKAQIRILGSDYEGKSFTGQDLGMKIHFHQRNHNKSTTALKHKIKKTINET